MYFGGFGPNNLLEGDANPAVGEVVRNVQLTIVSIACLTGVGVLAVRRWRAGRPLRRSVGLLVDAFGLALVMIAFLFLSLAFGGPWVAEIRWATFVAVAFAPAVFLAGLLQARLARSAVGNLVVELRRDLASADLRDALARTLRDPSLELAYWLPQFETYVDVDGQPVELEDLVRGRARTPIDSEGEHVAVLLHDPSLRDEPELLDAASPAAGIALENGRLQAELRARVNELSASRARIIEAGEKSAGGSSGTCTTARSSDSSRSDAASPARLRESGPIRRQRRCLSQSGRRAGDVGRRAARARAAASIRLCSITGSPSRSESLAARSTVADRCVGRSRSSASPRSSRSPPISSPRRRSRMSRSTRRRRR